MNKNKLAGGFLYLCYSNSLKMALWYRNM